MWMVYSFGSEEALGIPSLGPNFLNPLEDLNLPDFLKNGKHLHEVCIFEGYFVSSMHLPLVIASASNLLALIRGRMSL
jgi:hypothetical protein